MFYRNEIHDGDAVPARIAHPWHELEEYQPDGGMWSIPAAHRREEFIGAAERLMFDAAAFREAMRAVLIEWPRSIGVALTTPSLNRRAWLGHAGCYLATGSPEETTRLGWHRLDWPEQYAANCAADEVISEWRIAGTSDMLALEWGTADA